MIFRIKKIEQRLTGHPTGVRCSLVLVAVTSTRCTSIKPNFLKKLLKETQKECSKHYASYRILLFGLELAGCFHQSLILPIPIDQRSAIDFLVNQDGLMENDDDKRHSSKKRYPTLSLRLYF